MTLLTNLMFGINICRTNCYVSYETVTCIITKITNYSCLLSVY